jgi:hypothetical protein
MCQSFEGEKIVSEEGEWFLKRCGGRRCEGAEINEESSLRRDSTRGLGLARFGRWGSSRHNGRLGSTHPLMMARVPTIERYDRGQSTCVVWSQI